MNKQKVTSTVEVIELMSKNLQKASGKKTLKRKKGENDNKQNFNTEYDGVFYFLIKGMGSSLSIIKY